VLNRPDDPRTRIAAETRERVMAAILRTGYVADALARRQSLGQNRIVGVFTCEPTFPVVSADFYHPVLLGIEERAEQARSDLLLLTGATVVDGRRRIPGRTSQLRRADGCILLGGSFPGAELAAMRADTQPFVAVGRRDDAGSSSYVGADYPTATADLVRRAAALGHRSLAYVGIGRGTESLDDRMRGFSDGLRETGVTGRHVTAADRDPDDVLTDLRDAAVTAALVERYADAAALARCAATRQLRVPGDLSLLAMGDPDGPGSSPECLDLSGFRVPRRELGRQAMDVLDRLIVGAGAPIQLILPCEPVAGGTLVAPPPDRPGAPAGG
jgi:LacI family transcriptional regulator